MASLKEVKNRISSVKSTRQITSAMKMVASAKLHKAQGRIENMLPYQRKLNEILTNFLSTDATIESPYTDERPVGRVAIVAFSSNSSLCGAFNSNVAKMLERTLEEYQEMADKPSYMQAYELAGTLMKEFLEGRVDKVELIYHHFKSTGSQILTRDEYLPINLDKVAEEATESTAGKSSFNNDYIVEPSAARLITELLPKVLSQKIYTVLLDSNTSEHAARMLAMQAATDNANELIQDLTKQYNKSRQQAITNELLDIIGGSMK